MRLVWRHTAMYFTAFISCFALALYAGTTPLKDTVASAPLAWSLDRPADREGINSAFERLSQLTTWQDGKDQSMAAQDNNAIMADWHLLGTVRSDSAVFALVAYESTVKRYSVGDILPGGAKLVSVGNGHIEVSIDDKTAPFRIFDGKPRPRQEIQRKVVRRR